MDSAAEPQAMNDTVRHGIMAAFLRRKGCDGATQVFAGACGNAEAKRLNFSLEDGELVVVVTRHPSGGTLLVTTRRLVYMLGGDATILSLATIRRIRPHLFARPDRMYSMEVEFDKCPVLVVRTEPGVVFHAILGLLVNFAERQPQGGRAKGGPSGLEHLFDCQRSPLLGGVLQWRKHRQSP
jgi:hypothetical protein